MAECNYRFQDTAGAWQTITGKPAMMAALVDGRLEHLMQGGLMAGSQKEAAANSMKRREGDDSLKFSFAGQDAKSADLSSLHDAKSRIEDGEPAERVRKDTGWFKGVDGEWRFEFSDRDATLNIDKLDKLRKAKYGSSYSLGALLSHPKLYAAYPFLRSSRVFDTDFYEHSGSYDRDSGHFQVSVGMDNDKVKSFLLHEIQHAIQHREGFARGGSPTEMAESAPSDQALNDAKVLRARMDRGESSGEAASWFLNNLARDASSEARYLADRYSSRELHRMPSTPYEAYRRMAGEVEARNVQSRADMTDAERRATPPSKTADVAEKDQTVVMAEKDPEWVSPDRSGEKLKRSTSAAYSAQGVTAESLPGIFAQRFPKLAGAVRTMLDRGALGQKGGLVVLDSNDEATIAREFADRTGRSFDDTVQLFAGAGEDINAFYDPLSGITFMVGPNLSPSSMPSVVLHEMVHGQQRQALDQKAMALIEGRAKEAPALRAFLDRVAERMDTVGEEGNPFEATAYIVELATQEGRQAGFSRADGPMLAWVERNIGKGVADLVRDFVATVRAWAIAHGVELKNVAVDDLVAYAMAGVGKAARGRVVTLGKNSGSMASMSDRQGVAGKQAPTPAGDVEAGGSRLITSEHPKLGLRVPVRVIFTKSEKGMRFSIENGQAILRVNSVFSNDKQYVRTQFGNRYAIDDFLWPFDEDVFVRTSDSASDYEHIKKGTHRGSKNHATNEEEGGLSVSRSPAHAAGKYAYLVKGKVIGQGSDGEPLLDLESVKAASKRMSFHEALTKIREGMEEKAKSLGLSERELRAIRTAADLDFSNPNEPSASASPDAPGVSFSRSGIAGRVRAAAAQATAPNSKSTLGDLDAKQQAAVERVFGRPKTWRERAEEFAKDWQKNLVQGVFDQFAPIKEITSKGYMQARLAKGGDSTLEAMLLYGKVFVDKDGVYQVDYDGQNMNGFAKAMAKLEGEHDRFLAWVSGLRAERLAGVGLENLMTQEDIAGLKSLADGNTKSGKVRRALYGQALQDLNEFNDSVLKIAEDSGLIDEVTRKMYQDVPYVPFYRLSDEDVIQGPSVSKGLVNQSAWKQLKGGTNQLNEDLMGNLLKNWSHLITASANNRAAKEILDTAAKMGAATDVTNDVVAQDINGQPVPRGSTKGLVRYRGEIVRKIPKGQPYLENGQAKISDGTAEIKYIGERFFRVDDAHLMDAVASIGFTPKVWKPMADFKRYLTFGVTVNPTFKIRSLIRDSIQAVGTADLSYNPVQNILMGAKGTAMMSNVRAQMLASGGMLRFGSAEGGYSGHVRRLIEKGVDPQYILDDENKLKAFWKHKILPAFEAYQELGDRSENVNRAALYEQLLAKGMSHAEASFWARDMMDFSMHGKWAAVRTLTSVVPFMNARLQGIYKLGRATKADYRRMGATLAAVSMASIGLMLAYGDDDDWKKREDWDRDNSWWFKIGDTAFRIPKPFEIGAIGTIAERSLELMISDEMTGKRFGQRMRDLFMQNLSMNPTPQLVKPMIDLYANKDAFSGRDIETQGMEKMRPEDRYTARTSEVARFLGQIGLPNPAQLVMGRWEGLSPVQVDYLIRGYFSWLGTSATSVLDRGIRPMMDRGEQPAMRLRDTFLVGNFVESLPAGSSRYVTQFYDQAKEIEQMYASYQQAIKEGDMGKAQEIQAENPEAFAARRRIEAAKRAQSMISGRMRAIERDAKLSGEDKRAQLEALETQRDQVARRALMVPAAAGRD